MKGTLLNMATVLLGTGLGTLVGNRLSERLRTIAFTGLGLVTVLIGLQMAFKTQFILVPLLSLLLGGLIGESLHLEEGLENLGNRFSKEGRVSEGFVAATLLFCVGSMTVLGALEEGINGTFKIYAIKSIMDGISSVAFASAMGWGVGLSALSVLIIQGGLTLLASHLQPFLTTPMVNELSATGGLMLLALALGLLGIKKLPVASFLPALLLAPLFYVIVSRLPL